MKPEGGKTARNLLSSGTSELPVSINCIIYYRLKFSIESNQFSDFFSKHYNDYQILA